MSIAKKSLISNRTAVKKANLTKASATKVSSTKVGKILISPQCSTKMSLTHIKVR